MLDLRQRRRRAARRAPCCSTRAAPILRARGASRRLPKPQTAVRADDEQQAFTRVDPRVSRGRYRALGMRDGRAEHGGAAAGCRRRRTGTARHLSSRPRTSPRPRSTRRAGAAVDNVTQSTTPPRGPSRVRGRRGIGASSRLRAHSNERARFGAERVRGPRSRTVRVGTAALREVRRSFRFGD